ncbi:MAG TPA: DUF1178 family protein [Aestuariivirgaceae bacterium]|nr:DUF1178 family protein [Aestuariivirgaceae bacterium]
MIHYDLICKQGHLFDGWFSNSAAYDEQRSKSAVVCPQCGTAEIEKQIMAPGISGKSNRKSDARNQVFSGGADPRMRLLVEKMRELRQHIESHADYVGDRFAEEARRIHYKETEERGIYGEASAEDARSLIEEGIDVQPLPLLPEDRN